MSALGGGFSSNPNASFNRTTGKSQGSDIMPQNTEYERTMADLAKQYYMDTGPLRQGFLQQGADVLSGSRSPMEIPGFAQLAALNRQGYDSQYKTARENVLAQTPAGGQLTAALTNLENQRAAGVANSQTQLTADLIKQVLAQIYGAAFGAPGQALQGLAGSANAYASRYGATEGAQASRFGAHTSALASAGPG